MGDHRLLCVLITPLIIGCSTTRESPRLWSDVVEGMNRSAIADRIGSPDSKAPSFDTWLGNGWELRVAYDHDGHATNILRVLELR
jgi:hypothetical protein